MLAHPQALFGREEPGDEARSVCVCVCLSVTLHLTSRMFVRLTNDTTLTGNVGCVKTSEKANTLMSTAALLQRPLARCFDDRGF